MIFGKQSGLTFGALIAALLGTLVSATAIGQVTTRLVTAGGAATTATIAPGGSVAIDVRIDVGKLSAGGTGLIGAAFRLSQTAPASSGFFSITARSFAGSPFNDATSAAPDAVVLVAPNNLLNPANKDTLGRTTTGLSPTSPGANKLAANLTLTASPATPPGTYTIKAIPGASFASDNAGNDYNMSDATFTIIVTAPAAPPKTAK